MHHILYYCWLQSKGNVKIKLLITYEPTDSNYIPTNRCRFEGTDTGLRRKYQLRKRMSKAIGLDKEREREAVVAAAKAAEMEREMEMAVAADKNAMQGEQTRLESESTQVG